jgi:mannosyl-3-phosphoglycerate phosphatase
MLTNALVFTDLDGTLLDHHTYSFDAALPALNALEARNIPVILNSSKTRAEIRSIAQSLGLPTAIIAENGSLIALPDSDEPVIMGEDYEYICQQIDRIREEHGFQCEGFHDWSVDKVAEVTGLPKESAALARQREASEPLLWFDSEPALNTFKEALEQANLTLKRGGRFWHVMGNTDKVKSMAYVTKHYQADGEKPIVVALGDGPNDQEMIAAADIGVIVYNPDGTPLAVTQRPDQKIIRTEAPGPEGWNATLLALLTE